MLWIHVHTGRLRQHQDALVEKTGYSYFFMPFASAETTTEGCMRPEARWPRMFEKAFANGAQALSCSMLNLSEL